ncbi:MAG: ribonuclease J [bacterium]|nr:ribonuclease J [bacterium]
MKTGKDNTKGIKIVPLGGLGAIGKNMTLFEYKDEIIIVDCGVMFPTQNMPGVDLIIPDFSYIEKNKKKIKAIIITHGHEDHIGAVPFLLQTITAPVYATRLTIGLIRSRQVERKPKEETVFIEVKAREQVEIGGFALEFIKVNHSIPDGVGLAITTDVGTIIHSGDFKIDFSPVDGEVTDLPRFADYGEKGVLLLMSDSTNAEREGFTRSEAILLQKMIDIFSSAKGRIIVATFASNISRIQQVLEAAQRFNRKVAISGITMVKNIEIAQSLGYLDIKKGLIVNIEEANSLPSKKLVIIGTGSQGEPMSALSRMSEGNHRHFNVVKGDTVVITASVIPGNEKPVTNVVNSLMKNGVDVFYANEKDIHVSGHGSAKELKLMISLTKPAFFMPIHGEYKHLKAHAAIAEAVNIKSSKILIAGDGDILELTKKSFKRIDTMELPTVYVEGTEVGNSGNSVIQERLEMSSAGVIVITIVTAEGMLMVEPDVFTRGMSDQKNKLIRKEATRRVNRMLKDGLSGKEIESGLKRGLKKQVYKIIGKNPLMVIRVLEV